MRVERSGAIEPLTPRIAEFIEKRLNGRSLDEDGDVDKRPDYECFKGLLAIEIKSLETDPTDRLENALAPEKDDPNWPIFFGEWAANKVLEHFPNSEQLNKKLVDRLGRALVTHLKKANDQLANYTKNSKRRNLVRLLVILNEDHAEYAPDAVAYIIQRELRRKRDDGTYRYCDIDAVVFLSDRHVAALGKIPALPIIAMLGANCDMHPWKEDIVQIFAKRWATWNNAPVFSKDANAVHDFVAAEHIPDKVPQHEKWRLDYRRRPYMKSWKDEDLRSLWDHVLLLSLLFGHRETPKKIPLDGYMQTIERFSHLQVEVAERGLSLEYFEKDSTGRRKHVANQLPYGPKVSAWLHKVLDGNSDSQE